MMALLATVLVLPLCASAAVAASPARSFALADLFALRYAEDAQISPDGRHVAYVRTSADIAIDGSRHDVVLVDRADRRER